jgi:2-oxoglutarate dehydrogenase E1 component
MRLEQFYPFPALSSLTKELERFKDAEVVWCQEEPKNQGGWTFVEPNIEWVLGGSAREGAAGRYVGRPAAASPATGLAHEHKAEQDALVAEALTLLNRGK